MHLNIGGNQFNHSCNCHFNNWIRSSLKDTFLPVMNNNSGQIVDVIPTRTPRSM